MMIPFTLVDFEDSTKAAHSNATQFEFKITQCSKKVCQYHELSWAYDVFNSEKSLHHLSVSYSWITCTGKSNMLKEKSV